MDKRDSILKFVAVLALGAALAGCNKSEQAMLAQARQNAASGEYRTALIHMKNLLKDHPQNGQAWLMLGRASLMLGSPADAETELRKAEKYGVPAGEVAVPLARALLAQGKGEELLTDIKPGTVRNTADRAELLVVRGDAYLASDKAGQAEKSYQAALRIAPDTADATVGLAKVSMVKGDTAHAKEILQRVKEQYPDNPRAWLVTARMAMAANQYASAEDALRQALKGDDGDLLPQDVFMARATLADAEIRQGHLTDALKELKPLNDAAPDQPYANYLRALVAYKMNDYATAESRLQRVLRVAPSSVSAQLLLGAVSYAQGRYGQAEMHLSNVIGINPSDKKARKLLALTLYKGGQAEQALKVVRPVVGDRYSDAQLLAMMSKAGDDPESDVIPTGPQPKNAAESLQFARRYILSGKNESAVALLEKTPGTDQARTDFARERLLIVALLRQGETGKAVEEARALVKAHPDAAAPQVLLGGALSSAGDSKGAREHLERALELDPSDKLANMSLAELALQDDQYQDAEDYYSKVLDRHPDYVRAMLGMARAEDQQGHADKALSWVKKARAADPKALAPRLMLVRYYTGQGDAEQALTMAQEAAEVAPQNPVVLNALGIAQLNAGDKDAGIESFKAAVKGDPDSAEYRTNLARAQITAGQFTIAADNLESVVNRHPDYVPAVSLYALSQLQAGRLYEGVALAKSLRDSNPAMAYALEGDLYVLDKRYGEAVDAYRQALQHKQTRALVAKLLTAASAAKQAGAGDAALTWLQAHPDDGALRAALGDYYMTLGHNDKAMQEYAAVIEQYPNNVAVLNNMAWLYSLDHNDKAVDYATKAHKIAPKAAEITDTLGWALLQTGNAEKAVDVLRQAVAQAPKAAEMRYHLASALARSGSEDEARDMLKKLLASKEKFAARDEAQKLYTGLK
ncbi:MAG TPA: XrtA/PEP-CTERM system TPR-repeat protein PrsT [Gammaproteobacteria bacterium]|nr:XrtA/PEP-CTERM system TPR-repeat protein PrsT [Gammaproteobacteria bacterium]